LWQKLNRSKRYRESFPAAVVKRMLPLQIRVLRKQRGWSQAQLAQESKLTQGVISRAEDPDYGNLTINTLVRIAAGFDCAFIGRFVPFSELAKWYTSVTDEKTLEVPSFADDWRITDTLQSLTARHAGPSQWPAQWQNEIVASWAKQLARGTTFQGMANAVRITQTTQTDIPKATLVDSPPRKGPHTAQEARDETQHYLVLPSDISTTVCLQPAFAGR
jgi:transcriptional regulator with XRE-family HTH domain